VVVAAGGYKNAMSVTRNSCDQMLHPGETLTSALPPPPDSAEEPEMFCLSFLFLYLTDCGPKFSWLLGFSGVRNAMTLDFLVAFLAGKVEVICEDIAMGFVCQSVWLLSKWRWYAIRE
jgi:hypothetical protein